MRNWLRDPRTGREYDLIDANRLRRQALDMQARHLHEGVLANEMLAQSEYIKMHASKPAPDGVDPTIQQPGEPP